MVHFDWHRGSCLRWRMAVEILLRTSWCYWPMARKHQVSHFNCFWANYPRAWSSIEPCISVHSPSIGMKNHSNCFFFCYSFFSFFFLDFYPLSGMGLTTVILFKFEKKNDLVVFSTEIFSKNFKQWELKDKEEKILSINEWSTSQCQERTWRNQVV